MWTYAIKLRKDDNGTYLVTCPDLPEVTTFGETIDEACVHARDAIEEAIAARMADREPVPTPLARVSTKHRVDLSSQIVAKIVLYRAMRDKGVSKRELARVLGWHRPQVDRLLNLRHASNWGAMDAAFAALGARLLVDVES
jgi:antitoxin HicB